MAFNNMVGPRGRNDALAVTQPNTRLFTGSHVNPIGDVGLKRSRGNPPPNPEKPSPGWDLKDVPDPLPNVVLHLALQTLVPVKAPMVAPASAYTTPSPGTGAADKGPVWE
ncbi:uncharacterized protein ACWYII_025288 isoform 3-T3 [Salvelinus alpinus]